VPAVGAGCVRCLIYALACRFLIDLAIVWVFYPWRPRLSGNFALIRPYVRFGINMQAVRLLSYSKDYLPILLLVPLLGVASAGQWSWALAYIGIPIYFTRLVDRIMFPAYSRVQHDREAVGKLATTALWFYFAVGLPILTVLVLFAHYLVPLVYGEAWLAAVPVASWLAINMLAGFITNTGFPILYATGRSRSAVKTFGTWVVLTLFTSAIGISGGNVEGLAAGYSCATVVTSWVLVHLLSPAASINLSRALVTPLLAVIGSCAIALVGLATGLPRALCVVGFICFYTIIFVVLDWQKIDKIVRKGLVTT
jgi:O-antigen/teichoic acid export membrane protein